MPPLARIRLRRVVGDRDRLDSAVTALARCSRATVTGQGWGMHRLVQAVVDQALSRRQQRRWATVAVRLMRVAFPTDFNNPATWPRYAELLPHVLAVTETAETLGIQGESTTWLLTVAGNYLWRRAELPEAATLHERALAIREARLGADHPTPPPASTTSPASWPTRATWTAPAACTSAP